MIKKRSLTQLSELMVEINQKIIAIDNPIEKISKTRKLFEDEKITEEEVLYYCSELITSEEGNRNWKLLIEVVYHPSESCLRREDNYLKYLKTLN